MTVSHDPWVTPAPQPALFIPNNTFGPTCLVSSHCFFFLSFWPLSLFVPQFESIFLSFCFSFLLLGIICLFVCLQLDCFTQILKSPQYCDCILQYNSVYRFTLYVTLHNMYRVWPWRSLTNQQSPWHVQAMVNILYIHTHTHTVSVLLWVLHIDIFHIPHISQPHAFTLQIYDHIECVVTWKLKRLTKQKQKMN